MRCILVVKGWIWFAPVMGWCCKSIISVASPPILCLNQPSWLFLFARLSSHWEGELTQKASVIVWWATLRLFSTVHDNLVSNHNFFVSALSFKTLFFQMLSKVKTKRSTWQEGWMTQSTAGPLMANPESISQNGFTGELRKIVSLPIYFCLWFAKRIMQVSYLYSHSVFSQRQNKANRP